MTGGMLPSLDGDRIPVLWSSQNGECQVEGCCSGLLICGDDDVVQVGSTIMLEQGITERNKENLQKVRTCKFVCPYNGCTYVFKLSSSKK